MTTNMATITNETKSKHNPESNEDEKVRVIKTPTELQRLKLEKLMKNPTKEAFIPDKSKDKAPRAPLEFIRNIWGSSAGAGSGDFHVYRGVRRREYARQKFIDEKAKKDGLDKEFEEKMEQNKKEAEERTAKKRAKRLKQKEKLKAKRLKKKGSQSNGKQEKESSSSCDESEKSEDEGKSQDDEK